MGKDIVPELLQAIGDKFNDRTTKILKDKLQLISDKKATHKDSNELAIEVGNILADIFGEEINSDILPDGKMYYNIAKRLIEPSLKADHEIISTYTADVQTMLNEQAGISLQGIKAEVNQDRIDNMVDRLAYADSYDNIKWILDEPVKNYSQSVVDSTIKANADFQAKSGKPGKIIRREAGKCCKWCRDLAGSYKYGTEPRPNFYKRHAYCRCTIDYHPGNGKVQNSWSKKWRDEEAEERKDTSRSKNLSEKALQANEKKKRRALNNGEFVYVEASTIEEANEFARSMGYKADYKNIDIKCANEWNKGLYDANKNYPEVAKQIKFVGSSQQRYNLIKKDLEEYLEETIYKDYINQFRVDENNIDLKSKIRATAKNKARAIANDTAKRLKPQKNEMASSFFKKRTINIDPIQDKADEIFCNYIGITMSDGYFDNYDIALKNGKMMVADKFHPIGCETVKATFDHEFGHQLDRFLEICEDSRIQDLFDSKTQKEITDGLSQYAWKNGNPNRYKEMIAEGWSEYCNADEPREMAKTIGGIIEELWKKKH